MDEIHECLCTSKDEMNEAKAKKDDNTGFFMEKNRRAGREVRNKIFLDFYFGCLV